MFEEFDAPNDPGAVAEASWGWDEPDPPGLDVIGDPPPDLFDQLDAAQQAAWLAQEAAEVEADLATLSPEERFETQYGYPAVPGSPEIVAATSEAAAVAAQDLAVQTFRMRTIADAHRVASLLTAYEYSIEDLKVRFGPKVGDAAGLGGQAFCRSFGLLTKTHPNHVAHEVAAARTLRDRLPATWQVFQHGNASWSRVQTVVAQAEGLEPGSWAAYDVTAAGLVVTSNRLKDDLRKQRERLQDGTAAARARATQQRRRTSLELGRDGGVALVIEGLASTWVPINDGLHRAAVAAHGTDPQNRSLAALRHDIAYDILHKGLQEYAAAGEAGRDVLVPDRKPVEVSLILTVPALAWLGRTSEQAQLGGYGPIDLETAKDLAGSAKSFIRVLTHPFTGARLAMDRTTYSPPADLARWVRIRDGRSRFPGATRPAHLCDIDHAREWQHGGRTEDTNLITLDRSSHNAKSAGLTQEELHDTGIVGWTEAWGRYFEDPPADPLDPAPPDLLPRPAPPDDACPF